MLLRRHINSVNPPTLHFMEFTNLFYLKLLFFIFSIVKVTSSWIAYDTVRDWKAVASCLSLVNVYLYLKGFPPNGKHGLKDKEKKEKRKADPSEEGYPEVFYPTFNDLRLQQN